MSRNTNPTLVVYSIAKLVETALKRDSEISEGLNLLKGEHPEIAILQEKCRDSNAIVSISSFQGLVRLVQAGVLTLPSTLTMFLSMLPYLSSPKGVISALADLLVLDMKSRLDAGQKYASPFNLHSPQHPLLTVLLQSTHSWQDVVNQIEFLCTSTDELVRDNSAELVKPVVLHIMCDPCSSSPTNFVVRQQLWGLVISLEDHTLLDTCLPWLQIDFGFPQTLHSQLCTLHTSDDSSPSTSTLVLTLELASIADGIVVRGHDPRPTLAAVVKMVEGGCSVFLGSCVVMILSHTVTNSPALYLPELLSTCATIVEQNSCSTMAGQMLCASLLQWLAYPSILTSSVLRKAQSLLERVQEQKATTNSEEVTLASHASLQAHLAIRLYHLSSLCYGEPSSLHTWMEKLGGAPLNLRSSCGLFLGGLLICPSTPSNILRICLRLLLDIVKELPELGTTVLTLLLYRLAREELPESQLELIKGLPLLGKQKDNVSLVVHSLESLKGAKEMKPLVLKLHLELWKIEHRTFPYMHKMLLEENLAETSDLASHWDLVRAHVMKEICHISPSQHGADLVPILSSILNKRTNNRDATTSSLCLCAIVELCQAGVVDAASSWKVLASRLSRDKRSRVIVSLCKVLGQVAQHTSPSTSNDKLLLDVQAKLWSYISEHNDTEVVTAAFDALSNFSLDQFNLKILPPCYRQNLKLPSEYATTPIDAARKPEDVLPYIPGNCWTQLLISVPLSSYLVGKLLSEERGNMRGVLQRQPGRPEPALPKLGPSSVLLGLVIDLKKCFKDLTSTAMQHINNILAILAAPSPKPLPPTDWSFLEIASSVGPLQLGCLAFCASQAHASPSAQSVAKKILENLTVSVVQQKDEILTGFTCLGDLCKGIPPSSLRAFLNRALQAALTEMQNNDTSVLRDLLSHLDSVLVLEDIHEANRSVVSLLLEGLLEHPCLDDSEVLTSYVASTAHLSSKFLERMTSPSVWWELNPTKLSKAIHIRSHLAITSLDTETPFVWLNECIDAVASCPGQQPLLLERVQFVLAHNRAHSSGVAWLLELMGRIQASLSSPQRQHEVNFLCNLLTLTVIVLAGHDLLQLKPQILLSDDQCTLFPQALVALLQESSWAAIVAQVIDWMHHIIKSSIVLPELSSNFHTALQALRHTAPMKQPGVWRRIISL